MSDWMHPCKYHHGKLFKHKRNCINQTSIFFFFKTFFLFVYNYLTNHIPLNVSCHWNLLIMTMIKISILRSFLRCHVTWHLKTILAWRWLAISYIKWKFWTFYKKILSPYLSHILHLKKKLRLSIFSVLDWMILLGLLTSSFLLNREVFIRSLYDPVAEFSPFHQDPIQILIKVAH